MIRSICEWIAKRLPLRTITRDDGSPYLKRYYLCGKAPAYFPVEVKPRLAFLPTIFLHKFERSDWEEELHNHPWDSSLSFILAGGYSEERRVTESVRVPSEDFDYSAMFRYEHKMLDTIKRRVCKPFTFNHITVEDFHRVDLLEEDCWTIFITGKKLQSWGFWDRYTGKYLHWREHLAAKGHHQANLPKGEDD